MKRLTLSVTTLLLLFALTLINGWQVTRLMNQVTDTLELAEEAVNREKWGEAEVLVLECVEFWNQHSCYFNIVLRHEDTNEVRASFTQVLSCIQQEDDGEYTAANALLVAQLHLIAQMEAVNWETVL